MTTTTQGLTAPKGATPAVAAATDDRPMTFTGLSAVTEDGLDRTKGQLVRDAENGPLSDLLWETGAVLTGPAEWRIDTAEDGALYLAVDAPARRWDDNVRYRARDFVTARSSA